MVGTGLIVTWHLRQGLNTFDLRSYCLVLLQEMLISIKPFVLSEFKAIKLEP